MPITVEDIKSSPDILRLFYEALRDANQIVGEQAALCLTYLAAQTRRFDGDESYKPVGLTALGQSSSGKTYTQDTALKAVPPDDLFRITDMSEKVLTRMSVDDFAGKVVVLGEAEAMKNAKVAMYLRKLFDNGYLSYLVNEEYSDGDTKSYHPRKYELGPGCWFPLMTSTTEQIDGQNATRQLTVYSDDSEEQTRRVLHNEAMQLEDTSSFDFSAWIEFDEWQNDQYWGRVHIPYAEKLAASVTIIGPSLRRTFSAVLTLIAAHALLHRNSRKTGDDGRVIATEDDYRTVRYLVEPFLASEAKLNVPEALKPLVDVVIELAPRFEKGVSAKVIIDKMSDSQPTVYRLLKKAVSAGLLTKTDRPPYGYLPADGLGANPGKSYILPPWELL